jgi:hypothetical protein
MTTDGFKPDQAKLKAAFDEELAKLAVLWREIGALETEVDEKMRAAHALESKLSAWLPYFESAPPGSIEAQIARAMDERGTA